MSASAIDFSDLSKARHDCLGESLRDARIYGRRAKDPSVRVAWAEIETELQKLRKRWVEDGLLPAESQGELLESRG